MKYYKIEANCSNCGHTSKMDILVGKRVHDAKWTLPVAEVFEALMRLTGKDRDKICSGCSHLSIYEPYQEGDIVEQVCWLELYSITSKGETCPYYEKEMK